MDKDERRKTGLDEGSLTAGPDPPLVEDVSDPEEDNLDGLDGTMLVLMVPEHTELKGHRRYAR